MQAADSQAEPVEHETVTSEKEANEEGILALTPHMFWMISCMYTAVHSAAVANVATRADAADLLHVVCPRFYFIETAWHC